MPGKPSMCGVSFAPGWFGYVPGSAEHHEDHNAGNGSDSQDENHREHK